MKQLKLVVEIENDGAKEELTLEIKGTDLYLKVGDTQINIMATDKNVTTLVGTLRAACSAGRDIAMTSIPVCVPQPGVVGAPPQAHPNSIGNPYWHSSF